MNAQKIDQYVEASNRLAALHPHRNAHEYDSTLKTMDEVWKALSDDEQKVAEEKTKPKSFVETAPRQLELVTPPDVIKLDLACGLNCKEGFQGVDIPGIGKFLNNEHAKLVAKTDRIIADDQKLLDLKKAMPTIKHELNLLRFPWPWETSSVTEIHCSHFVEHIPMIYVDEFGTEVPCGSPGAKDLFFKFFDEIHRVLKPGGIATIVTPNARNNRAFQDPTHRRFLVAESFFYLFKEFRRINKLEHYNVECDFDGNINPTVDEVFNLKDTAVQAEQSRTLWNVIHDWHVVLKSNKK